MLPSKRITKKRLKRIPAYLYTRRLACVPAVAGLLYASHAFASVPAVIADAQQTVGTNLWNPQNVAVAPNGTIYVADTSNNQVVKIVTNLPGASTQKKVVTTGYTLTAPQGIAVDYAGDLYVGDTPVLGVTGRILELLATNGVLNGSVKKIYAGGLLDQPLSLAVDNANNLFIGNSEAALAGSIYRIAAGSKTPVKLNITGLPAAFAPSALVTDSNGHLFIANSVSTNGGVYCAPATGGASQSILTGSFVTSQPEGLALDYYGDLFVLSQLSGGPAGERLVEIPNASVVNQSTPYLIPSSNLANGSGLALDPAGDLDVVELGTLNFGVPEKGTGLVTQIDYLNPVYLGAAKVFGQGAGIVFNFGLNAPATFSGLRAVTVGDLGGSSDVIELTAAKTTTGNCTTGKKNGATEYAPYTCYETFAATPQYTGTRVSAIQVKGSGSAILNSSAVYELGQAAAQVAYPLDVAMTQLGLIEPQGVAISGFNQTVYIADQRAGKVYSIAGVNGSKPTAVFTGVSGSPTALIGPSAVVMNGRGDLYIADFSKGEVIVVPTTTGIAPFVLDTGGLLQHPIALAIDDLGDLFVGDAGPDGDGATASAPGFVVEIPYRCSPFVVPTPGVLVIFPQALAVNSMTGDLFIGDGGDVANTIGQVVEVPAMGNASVLSITTPAVPTDPTGLGFDAAGNLYVLDGMLDTITVVSPTGASALLPIANTDALNAASALATTAGSQSFVVTNLGGGTANSLVYLNGNSATLAFANQVIKTASPSQTATVTNIGNEALTLKQNFYTPKSIPGFIVSGSDTCAGGDSLTSSSPSCAFSWQFEPTATGQVDKTVSLTSNAYNSGIPVINLVGDGIAKGKLAPGAGVKPQHPNRAGRKSFADAGRNAGAQ